MKRLEFVAVLLSALSLIPAANAAKKLVQEGIMRSDDTVINEVGPSVKRMIEMDESEYCLEDSKYKDVNVCELVRNNKPVIITSVDGRIVIPIKALTLTSPSRPIQELKGEIDTYNKLIKNKGYHQKSVSTSSPNYVRVYNDFSTLLAPAIIAATVGLKLGQTAFEIGEEKQKAKLPKIKVS